MTTVTCSYCGELEWTIRTYGRVTHKENCPWRTERFSQTFPFADFIRKGELEPVEPTK
jgi:hypothetical protein